MPSGPRFIPASFLALLLGVAVMLVSCSSPAEQLLHKPVELQPAAVRVASGSSPADQLLQLNRPLVIAHRGYPAVAPENTLPSFELALQAGADLVELDYHHSSDGIAVVMHDPTLDRTTDATARWNAKAIRLADHTAAELQTLDAGAWFHPRFAATPPPRLTEALDLINRTGVTLIERKAGDAASCVQLLRERQLINRVVVQSFDWAYLRAFHALAPEQVLGALGPRGRADGRPLTPEEKILGPAHLDEIAALGARVAVWSKDVTRESVQQAHARGLKVWVYTINEPAQLLDLLALGVDGFITNQTPLLWKTLATRPAAPPPAP